MTGDSSSALRSALIELLGQRSVRTGDFTLSSGKKSTFYIDARPSTMSASGLCIIGSLGLDEIRATGWKCSAIGGMTLGADPVSYAIAAESHRRPPVLDAFTVRKEAKGHGTGRRIEGNFAPEGPVIVVEDVITTGGSALQAVEVIEKAGGSVSGVLAVVDREEGGREAIEEQGYPVRSLVTLTDLGVRPG